MSGRQHFHNLADARSWALHVEVARRLTAHPELIERAKDRVRGWMTDPSEHPYATDWDHLLSSPLESLTEALTDKHQRMCTLRQASPFAGVLDSRTRWLILKRPELRPREAG